MPFSVSIGDALALCEIMIKGVEAICSGRKAAKAYRKLREELEDFRELLGDIKPLSNHPPSPAAQRLLEIIDEKVLAYQNALDKFVKKNRPPTTLYRRFGWSFGADKRAASLRGELAKYHRSLMARLVRFYAQQQVDCAQQQADMWLQYHAAVPIRDLYPNIQTITIVDPVGERVLFPLLLCNTYSLLMDVLPIYYKHNALLPGRNFVLRGDFQFVHMVSREIVESARWSAILSDSVVVEMSMILRQRNVYEDRCLKCGQSSTVTSERGWATCSGCAYDFRVTPEEVANEQAQEPELEEDVDSDNPSPNRFASPSSSRTQEKGKGRVPDWLRFRLLTIISLIYPFRNHQRFHSPFFIPPSVEARLKEMHEDDVKIFYKCHPKLDHQEAVLDYLHVVRQNSTAPVGVHLVELPPLPAELLDRMDISQILSSTTTFSSNPDAPESGNWTILPEVKARYDNLPQEYQVTFDTCQPHHNIQSEVIDYLDWVLQNPNTPPPPKLLDAMGHRTDKSDRRNSCGMKNCERNYDTAEHFRQHLRGPRHFPFKFYQCASCPQRFYHKHDCERHEKRYHPILIVERDRRDRIVQRQPKPSRRTETHENAAAQNKSSTSIIQEKQPVPDMEYGIPSHPQNLAASAPTRALTLGGIEGININSPYNNDRCDNQPSYTGPERTGRPGRRLQPYSTSSRENQNAIPSPSTTSLTHYIPIAHLSRLPSPFTATFIADTLADLSTNNAVAPNPFNNPSPHQFNENRLQDPAPMMQAQASWNGQPPNYDLPMPFYPVLSYVPEGASNSNAINGIPSSVNNSEVQDSIVDDSGIAEFLSTFYQDQPHSSQPRSL